MTEKALETLSDDQLLSMVLPDIPSVGNYTDDELMNLAQTELLDSIDTKSGADAGVRAQVAAAQSPNDKIATLKKFFPDAIPVEVLDPKSGAARFGRGNFVFTNPETGTLTLFDEDVRLFGMPIPTLGDFADAGPEIAETIGGIGGGIAGAAAAGTAASPTVIGAIPAATAGFVAGEGLGSAAAREAYIGILDYFGETEDTRTGVERLGDFSTTAAVNAAAGPIVSKIFNGVKFAVGGPIRYAVNSMDEAAKGAMEKMKRTGMSSPTAGQVSGNPLVNLFEQYLAASPASVRIMKENAEKTLIELDEATAKLAGKYGGVRTTSEAADQVMGAAQAARARYDEQVNAMYDEVGDLIGDTVRSDAGATRKFQTKYLAQSKTATGAPDLNPALEQAGRLLQDAADGVLDYNQLKNFRSSLLKTVRKAESQAALSRSEAKVKELIGYVTADLDNLVKAAQDANTDASVDIFKKFKAANAFVKKNNRAGGDINFVDEVIKKGDKEATAALKYVIGGAKDSGERLEKLRRQFEPDEYNVISGYMLGKLGMPGAGAVGGALDVSESMAREAGESMLGQGFSPHTFVTRWEKISPEAKKALFGGTEYADLAPALDDLVFTLNRVGKTAQQMANPSGTARIIGAMGTFGPLAAETGKLIGGDGFEFGLSGLIAPYASAKLMTNPSFVKWLSEGVEIAAFKPNSFGQHIRRLVQISEVNPDIRDEVKGVIQGLSQDAIEPMEWENSKSQQGPKAIPENNEAAFRQVVPKSTADKLLPNREELMASLDSISIPQVGSTDGSMFEPLPSTGGVSAPSSFQSAMSPTILPNDADRELASRMQANRSGIAGLV
ncbi:MAG: hypothetical protein CMJ25_28055 [Phycisphaerae bacterium]|nr:hypothetical protein [Phycisphaerae bacterium]